MNEKKQNSGGVGIFTIEFLVGVFFFLAVLLVLYFTAVIDGKNWFSEKSRQEISIRFESVDNLSINDKVFLRGMEIGVVRSFKLNEEDQNVMVFAMVDSNVILHKDYYIEIRHTSLLGGKHIHINPGTPGTRQTEDDPLLGHAPGDILHQISSILTALREDEQKLREEVLESDLLKNLQDTASGIKDTVDKMQVLVGKIDDGQGTLGKLINDPSLYDNAQKMVSEIDEASSSLKQLMADINSGKGSLGKLVNDDEAYDSLKKALRDLQETSEKIAAGKGSFGRMVNDDGKLYESMLSAVESTQKISEQLADGQGTLGRLIMDDSLYKDTRETVNQLRGAVEDYREQAPIATFGSMVFGAL